jgi:hypothetical protein
MKTSERLVLVYGLSVGGAALLSYLRGKRGLAEIGSDAVIQGVLVGTGVNVILYMKDSTPASPIAVDTTPVKAVPNRGQASCPRLGSLTKEGIAILSQINPKILYKAAEIGKGVLVGLSPEDPHHVVLPKE